MTDEAAPVLVLAAGQRCGSTLLQRLLCSHPQVRIWGEHAGQVHPILVAAERLRYWSDIDAVSSREEFECSGYQGFIPNLTPDRGDIEAACRAFIETLFAKPACDAGRPIWGFKEVRYALSDVLLLRRLFPHLRVLQLVRDPRDVLCSLAEWEHNPRWTRRDTELALGLWNTVAGSFVGSTADPDLGSFILTIRYEDLVADRRRWTVAVADHCALDPDLLDESVFDKRIHAGSPWGQMDRDLQDWARQPPALRALLDHENIQMVASAYGYDLS